MLDRKWRKKKLRGYRLHTERLLFSGNNAIRSIKFPIVANSPENTNEVKAFVEKVRHDYLACAGNITLIDWKEGALENAYSVLDFWVDSLRAGVRFFHKESLAQDFVRVQFLKCDFRKLFCKYWMSKESEFQNYIDLSKAYDLFVSRTSERSGKKSIVERKLKLYRGLVKKEFLKKGNDYDERAFRVIEKLFELIEQEKNPFEKDRTWEPEGAQVRYKRTFLLLPDTLLLADTLLPQQVLEERMKPYSSDPLERDEYLGFANNYGAFSNYFGDVLQVLQEDPEKLIHEILSELPFLWSGKEESLRTRIFWLAERAQRVTHPELANHWGDYRSFFGGKLSSWVSNYFRQKEEIVLQVWGKHDNETKKKGKEVKKTIGHLATIEGALQKEVVKRDPELITLLKDIKIILEEAVSSDGGSIQNEALDTYRILLGEARIKLNAAYQNFYPEKNDDDGDEFRAHSDLPELFQDIKRLPGFIGDIKRGHFESFIKQPLVLQEGVAFLDRFEAWRSRKIFRAEGVGGDYVLALLERLRQKYVQKTLVSTRGRHMVLRIFDEAGLREVLLLGIVSSQSERVLYVHPRARKNKPVFELSQIQKMKEPKVAEAFLEKFMVLAKPKWTEAKTIEELNDFIELEKIRLGVFVKFLKEDRLRVDDLPELPSEYLFLQLRQYIALGGKALLTKNELGRILQNFILSFMKGAVYELSRAEYIERYCITPLNTEQNYPIFKGKTGQWGIALRRGILKRVKEESESESVEAFTRKKFDSSLVDRMTILEPGVLAKIQSSVYQMQFLEKAVSGLSGSWYAKRGLISWFGSYSFIVEQKIKVNWQVGNNEITLGRMGDARLFVSIPFSLESTANINKGERDKRYEGRKNFLGIDVGEYGVAYVLIDRGSENFLESGFIYEPLTHKIGEYISTLKNRQACGTFSIPSTKLERLRDNAVTHLRNKIHALALTKNAVPVYEKEIDAFEAGSGRVAKIYRSLKRADVGQGGQRSKADNAEVNLVWGTHSKNFGREVNAAYTSYICSDIECAKSPYEIKYSLAERRELKKFARPSLMEFLNYPESKAYRKESLEKFKNMRGNSAIYVCPFCKKVFDADKQAAYWIALRRILSEEKNKNKKKEDTWERVTVEELIQRHRKNRGKAIFLTL